MDPLSIGIVNKCCLSSDNIRDYFLDERYLVDIDQNDMITPETLSITAVDLVLDELSEIGIETNFRAEELMLSPLDMNTMFDLRAKFDKDNFYRCLKDMSEETYGSFCGIIENVHYPEDLLIEISDFMTAIFPHDTSWEIIQNSIEYWYSTGNFSKHVAALISKINIHSDPNKTPITDDNVVEISQFLENMKERDNQVKLMVNYILRHVFSIDGNRLMTYVKEYDRDKTNPDVIASFAHYSATKPEEEPDFVKQHHEKVSHHLEYWKLQSEVYKKYEIKGNYGPNLEQAIMILVSLVLDGYFGDELHRQLLNFKQYMMPNVWTFTEKIATFDYTAILKGEIK